MLILEELAVLFKREIGVAQDLPGQRLLQRPALASRGAARRLRIDAPGLSRLSLRKRLTLGSETPKVRETSLRGIPRSTAASTLSLRSFE